MKHNIKFIQNMPEINLIERKIGPASAGEEMQVRPWEAVILERHEFIQQMEGYTPAGIKRRVLSEGRASELKELPKFFYETLCHRISLLRNEDRSDEIESIKDALDSLIDLRIQKIMRKAPSSVPSKNLPIEEQFLINHISELIKNWKKRLDNLFEKNSREEVGAHEKRFRRYIREIVEDTTNIQEPRIPSTDLRPG